MTSKKNKAAESVQLDIFGTKPKASREIEYTIISCLLIDSEAIDSVIDVIKTEMFFYPDSRVIYDAIATLHKKRIGIDIITLIEELKQTNKLDEAGGVININNILSIINSSIHIEHYTKILHEYYIERQIVETNIQILQQANAGNIDALELLDLNQKKVTQISDSIRGNTIFDMKNAILSEIKLIGERIDFAKEGKVLGVPTGFKELDKITGGWQKSDLIIVAGRPSMGKTAATLNFARNAAIIGGVGVGVFSMEMSQSQITSRLISAETSIDSDSLRRGLLSDKEYQRLTESLDTLSSSRIFMDDTPALTIMELRARARRMKFAEDIGLIVIDYLQLMSGGGKRTEGTREQEISNISRGLKSLAKELNIPIIALSQLSRAVDARAGEKKPILSDLRESGAIEQDADIVMFLYRAEYYGLKQDTDGKSLEGLGEFIIAKNRNGTLGNFHVRFEGRYVRFRDLDFDDSGSYMTLGTGGGKSVTSLQSSEPTKAEYGEDTPF